MKISQDRRKMPRYQISLKAELHTSSFYISGRIIDISIEGIRIETYIPLEPETDVAVYFNIGKEIIFKGIVIWVITHKDKRKGLYEIGIEVEHMAIDDIEVLGFDIREELVQEITFASDDQTLPLKVVSRPKKISPCDSLRNKVFGCIFVDSDVEDVTLGNPQLL